MTRRLCLAILVVLCCLVASSCGDPAGCSRQGSTLAALPPEAAATLERIRGNGPFPYRQDGSVFANREGLLPAKPHGYYREYTVPTPGAPDRGARRIVAGGIPPQVYYYSGDHYRSFQRLTEMP